MKRSNTAVMLMALSSASIFNIAPVHAENADWQRVHAPQQATVQVNNALRDIYPGCANEGDDYSFYFKPGKLDKLATIFNGGGACWNGATCIDSLNPQVPVPAYVPSDELPHNDPTKAGGLLNLTHADNPYKDWSMVYLPYCTGDVHFGSQDVQHAGMFGTRMIRHRGFDNFLYAREWTKQYYANLDETPDKVLVIGASAGAYGAILNYPHIKDIFPEAKGYLLADGGSGVMTESLLVDGIRGADSAWNFDENYAQSVPALASVTGLDADSFITGIYSALTNHYPKDNFSQYSTVYDVIQIMFYNIMLNSDDMSQWPNLTPQLFGEWAQGLLTHSYTQAASPNFHFYIAPGCQHTILRSDEMYSEQTVGGTKFVDWFDGLVNGQNKKHWDNLSCTDEGCQYEQLTPEQIGACFITP